MCHRIWISTDFHHYHRIAFCEIGFEWNDPNRKEMNNMQILNALICFDSYSSHNTQFAQAKFLKVQKTIYTPHQSRARLCILWLGLSEQNSSTCILNEKREWIILWSFSIVYSGLHRISRRWTKQKQNLVCWQRKKKEKRDIQTSVVCTFSLRISKQDLKKATTKTPLHDLFFIDTRNRAHAFEWSLRKKHSIDERKKKNNLKCNRD